MPVWVRLNNWFLSLSVDFSFLQSLRVKETFCRIPRVTSDDLITIDVPLRFPLRSFNLEAGMYCCLTESLAWIFEECVVESVTFASSKSVSWSDEHCLPWVWMQKKGMLFCISLKEEHGLLRRRRRRRRRSQGIQEREVLKKETLCHDLILEQESWKSVL